MKDNWRRIAAMTRKEFIQLRRDRSNFLIGIVFPIILIFIIGYGVSMDVKKVPVTVFLGDTSPTVHDMLSFLNGSEYFAPHYTTSMKEAALLMDKRHADVIIAVPPNFTADFYQHRGRIQVILYGVDAGVANIIKGYVESGLNQWQQKQMVSVGSGVGSVTAVNRMWFNDANSSTWYFIPGIIVLIMSIVGIFLTALVMAKEWERGTFEAVFVTPVRIWEIILAKITPCFCIALLGFTLCLLAGRFIFQVPIHGSLILIIFSTMLYLVVALAIGMLISSITKSQFLACQMALIVSLLPVMMLSGFLFDLRSVPAWISSIGYVLPPTYYMQLLKTLFLAGNNWWLIIKNNLILGAYAILFVNLSLYITRKKLE